MSICRNVHKGCIIVMNLSYRGSVLSYITLRAIIAAVKKVSLFSLIFQNISSEAERTIGVVFQDSHDMVIRFNNAPTVNFTDDVGCKTTFRILNSQVVTKPEFNFLTDPLYKNISILIWDPANYSSTVEDWFHHPDFPLFPVYKKLLDKTPNADVHLLNPQVLWELWKVLQNFSPYRLRRNPPSSGFLGLWLALQKCDRVRAFEYVPSARATRRCHYYSSYEDTACTFGAWHPLAQEKALAEKIRRNSDIDVFQRGFIDIPGLNKMAC